MAFLQQSSDAVKRYCEVITALHGAGFAVIPAVGKKPTMLYRSLTQRVPLAALLKRAEKFANHDFVCIPGLTLVQRGQNWLKLIVLDGDDADAVRYIDDTFGPTPGKVKTRRGGHRYYLVPLWVELPTEVTNLRHLGINVDIKHGQRGAIAVLPPSRHEKDREFQYSWDGCDETVLKDLPLFPLHVLESLLGKRVTYVPSIDWAGVQGAETGSRGVGPLNGPNVTITAPGALPPPVIGSKSTDQLGRFEGGVIGEGDLRGGSRNQGLNDYLCGRVWDCQSEAELIALARSANEKSFQGTAKGLLEDTRVVEVASRVWADRMTGDIRKMKGERIQAVHRTSEGDDIRIDGREVDTFNALGMDGVFAHHMLHKLRAEHHARILRGETFAIAAKAMATQRSVPFNKHIIRRARDLLLHLGFIQRMSSGGRFERDAAQYALAEVKYVQAPNQDGELTWTTECYLSYLEQAKKIEAEKAALVLDAPMGLDEPKSINPAKIKASAARVALGGTPAQLRQAEIRARHNAAVAQAPMMLAPPAAEPDPEAPF